MKRWAKVAIAGTVVGGAAYGIDAAISRKQDKHPYALALIPGVILGVATGLFTWILTRPEPGEDFPKELGYYDWPPGHLPSWTYVEGVNLPRIKMPPGTAGGMYTR